ncbi:hypothetical protein A5869_001265, partial [Enterococcus cecorum]
SSQKIKFCLSPLILRSGCLLYTSRCV